MDLKGILNDGPGGQDSTKTSLDEQRERASQSVAAPRAPPPPPPPPLTTGVQPLTTGVQPPTPSNYGHHSALQTPLFGPSSASPVRQPYAQSQSQTPVKTPSQGLGGGGYPFPQHPLQSPAGGPPFQRPPSHGYQYPPPPAAQHATASLQAYPTSSLSPTPPSNQSPYAPRQSPMSARSHMPNQPIPQHQYPYAQPTTPFAAPNFHRTPSGLPEAQSPFHQRTYSSTSNGVAAGSPGHYLESPSTYNRPLSQQRQSAESPGRVKRERSESVSPKTKVPPRPVSIGSRQGSEQETYSSRGTSVVTAVPANPSPMAADPRGHVMPHAAQAQAQAQAPFDPRPNWASEVPQKTPISGPAAAAAPMNAFVSSSPPDGSLPRPPLQQQQQQQQQQQRPPLIHHHSSKMGMSHLLTPANEVPPAINGSLSSETNAAVKVEGPNEEPGHSIKGSPKKSPSLPPLQTTQLDDQVDQRLPDQSTASDAASSRAHAPQYQQQQAMAESRPPLKRSAESEIADAPPSKQQRRAHKRPQRPIWAKLSEHNPKSHGQDTTTSTAAAAGAVPGPNQASRPPNTSSTPQPNGLPNAGDAPSDDTPPWAHQTPLDQDLLHARKVLGQWEKTFKWNTPYPDMLRAVQDWLYQELEQLGDVGRDPREGTVEIEAKFGTLMKEDDRYELPVMNACVINPHVNNRLHFESTMSVAEHKHMNQFLNGTITASMQPGRVRMSYLHLYETDSFHSLSALGQQALPQSIQRRQGTRHPRLRITRKHNKDGTRPITARIVKIPIANLHILNPGPHYDCRISINLEVNLDRPDWDLDALIADDAQQPSREVDRIKDRIAYKHLAYSIDLTKVERQGLEPSHELELEVDSNVLREQMALMKEGKPHAFGDVVAGFLDNATFLMRTRPSGV